MIGGPQFGAVFQGLVTWK